MCWRCVLRVVSAIPRTEATSTPAPIQSEAARTRDSLGVSWIGNPAVDDIGARFRGVNEWAVKKGYLGAFPNSYHADYAAGRVGGAILVKPSAGEWRDVLINRAP